MQTARQQGITLRSGTSADIDAMYHLDQICFPPPFRFTRAVMRNFASEEGAFTLLAETPEHSSTHATAINHRPGLELSSPPASTRLPMQDPAIAAFIIIQVEHIDPRHQAYIVTLDVAPAHRRQGLAHRLMEAAEEQAAAQGASLMTLHVWAENTPAIAFYERSGYERTLFHPNLYAPGIDAYGYLKSL